MGDDLAVESPPAVLAPFRPPGSQVRFVGLQHPLARRMTLYVSGNLVRKGLFAGRLVVDLEVSCDARQVFAFGMSFSDLLVSGEPLGLCAGTSLFEVLAATIHTLGWQHSGRRFAHGRLKPDRQYNPLDPAAAAVEDPLDGFSPVGG